MFLTPCLLIAFDWKDPQRASESSIMPNSVDFEITNEPSSEVIKETEAEGSKKVSNDDERVEVLRCGMEFSNEKELMAYYKRYAKQAGFGVKTFRTKRDVHGNATYVTIGCARAGKYMPSHSNVSRLRPTTKTGCNAKVNAKLANGVWVLTTIENTHNHSTVSPKKSRFFRSHKCLDEYSQRMLDLNDRASIRMNKNFGALVQDAGGLRILIFKKKIVAILLIKPDTYG
ncbi:protein FAR1-RELATED SEQUENCE 4-like isoform X2 [Juglans microcarpa x Juglans regia]|uniref:protein FAR1-RELATED SEQUENCE 4-like isoform X2 n=2 Tax=Juglans microcarpa x Juglans regia TaxID=2249226 RepID=UPI001B7D92CC|nr:protein FAR1-RELATED SEQUENCE 4-like isoform X2 [Juglans microcarpa x Juglans regia]